MLDSILHAKVLQVLNKHDPIEFYLTAAIYPSDEYASEAEDIAVRLQTHWASLDVAGVRRIVHKVFKDSFSSPISINDDKYGAIAEDLMKALFSK